MDFVFKLLCFSALVLSFSNAQTIMQCGTASSSKRILLNTPAIPNTVCAYTIRPLNSRVCQLYVQFNTLSLAQPSVIGTTGYPICLDEKITIGNIHLCGENSKQHIYVPFNATLTTQQTIGITIETRSRAENSGLARSQWSISITQLECPSGSPIIKSGEVQNYEGRSDDGFFIAPVGCLQYYPSPRGTFETFNYNSGNGPYLGDLDYAICFRRTSATRQLELLALTFEMSSASLAADKGYDEDCYSSISQGRDEDFLFVPAATQSGQPDLRANRFCGTSMKRNLVISRTPGPLMVQFKSDKKYDKTLPEKGFRVDYFIN